MISRDEKVRRLKAARWLRGPLNAAGNPTPLSVAELATRGKLPSNKIRRNRIEEIEQQKIEGREMDFEKLADALGLPHEWFTEPDLARVIPGATAQPADVDDPEEAAEKLAEAKRLREQEEEDDATGTEGAGG